MMEKVRLEQIYVKVHIFSMKNVKELKQLEFVYCNL
jgi:hypothetical protein